VYKLILNDLNKQTTGWSVNVGPDINIPEPTSFTFAQPADSGVIVSTNTGPANAGGLLAFKTPFPVLPEATMTYFGVDLDVMILDSDIKLLRCLEIDLKVAKTGAPAGGTLANVADGSGQYNVANGFWQIDTAGPSPVWTDTPYQPTPLGADTWTHFSSRYNFDWATAKTSVLSAKFGADEPAPFPAALGGLPLLVTNWNSVIALQLQTCLEAAGTLNVYYNNITLTISDTPFA
jgi:hypothetical protein